MLKKRLSTCMSYLKGHHVLYDIGTDHAYLPIAAIKEGLIKKAYAVDNKKGPLESAKSNIEAHGLSEYVLPVLSSGIDALSDDVDVINMAGLGGNLIYEIFNQQSLKQVKRLILQPNNHPEKVRKLTKQGLKIVDETVVTEDDIHYVIIVLEPGEQTYTHKEITFGPILLKKKQPAFKAILETEVDYLNTLIKTIPYEDAKTKHIKRLYELKEVLDDWNNH